MSDLNLILILIFLCCGNCHISIIIGNFLVSILSTTAIYFKLILGNISMHGSWVISLATSANQPSITCLAIARKLIHSLKVFSRNEGQFPYVENFFLHFTGFILLLKTSFEKTGSFTMSFSSFTKSMRSANSGTLFSFLLICNTFLDHWSLVPPGSFDSSMHSSSGVSKTFQVCICVMVSHFNRKFRNLL